jgi:hypothetical protein
MSGSSIAAPDALGWVTDFLNAAYFARPQAERDVDDLRLAFTVLTTAWARRPGRRLHAVDLAAFHRTFALRRLRARPRFTLGATSCSRAAPRCWATGSPLRRTPAACEHTASRSPTRRRATASIRPCDCVTPLSAS